MIKEILILLLILVILISGYTTVTLDVEKPDGGGDTKPVETQAPAQTEKPTQVPGETEAPAQTETPDQTETPTQTEAPTEAPAETQAPPQTEAPTQTPTEAPTEPEVSGPNYTQDQLLALSNDHITYGPGTATNSNPAPYAPDAQKRWGKYDAHFIEDAENVIYLTFDCGYEVYVDDEPVTGMILDVLKEKNVKALFFITGSYAEKNPAMVRRILAEGHALGNHSADHASMPTLGIEDMEKQILELHEYVKEHFLYTMKFFRPPEGSFSQRSLAVTQNLGYETVHWSFGYADWDPANQPDPAEALDKILSCHHDGAIYLLHALSITNAQVLGDVIDGFHTLGYKLEVLS